MLSVDIVEYAVIGLGYHGIGVPIVLVERGIIMMTVHPLPGRVADGAYAARIGDEDRCFQETGFGDPVRTRHVPVAVQRIPGGIDGIECRPPWEDGRHTRTHGT